MEWTFFILNMLTVTALSPLTLGIIRKVKARAQNRSGASVLQPYRDLIKLFHKDEVISADASWIFSAAPVIVFAATLALAPRLPFFSPAPSFFSPRGLLVFVYFIATGAFFLALAGLDTGSGFGGIGSSREMTIAALTEGGLILSLVAVALLTGAANLGIMSAAVSGLSGMALLPLSIAAAAFSIALLAENARYPVDNPATHLELTMVHEAMILEYSGPKLALMEWASASKLLIFIAVFVNIFFPWGLGASLAPTAPLLALGIFLAKVCVS